MHFCIFEYDLKCRLHDFTTARLHDFTFVMRGGVGLGCFKIYENLFNPGSALFLFLQAFQLSLLFFYSGSLKLVESTHTRPWVSPS